MSAARIAARRRVVIKAASHARGPEDLTDWLFSPETQSVPGHLARYVDSFETAADAGTEDRDELGVPITDIERRVDRARRHEGRVARTLLSCSIQCSNWPWTTNSTSSCSIYLWK